MRESKHGHARNRHSAERATPAKLRQIVLASVLGTAVEWYDFLIYGVGAALVFNKLFFPTFDPLVGTLAAFGSCVGRRDRRKGDGLPRVLIQSLAARREIIATERGRSY